MNAKDMKIGMKVRTTNMDHGYQDVPIGSIKTIMSILDDGSALLDDNHYYYASRFEPVPSGQEKGDKMSLEEAYITMQNACGIKVGDTVKVLRAAKDYEMGWKSCWSNYMNEIVGKTMKVIGMGYEPGNGFVLNDKYEDAYPFFVLEKVSSGPDPKVVLTLKDLPTQVLIDARDSYTKKLDKGSDAYNRDVDWNAGNCSICRHIKQTYKLKYIGNNRCTMCPLIKDNWCDVGLPKSRLYLTADKNTQTWKEDVAKFICEINKEVARR